MECRSCGTPLPQGVNRCLTCGTPVHPQQEQNTGNSATDHSSSTVAMTSPYGAPPSGQASPSGSGHPAGTSLDPYMTSFESNPAPNPTNASASNPYGNAQYDFSSSSSPDNNQYDFQIPPNPYSNVNLPGTGTSNPYDSTIQAPPPPPPAKQSGDSYSQQGMQASGASYSPSGTPANQPLRPAQPQQSFTQPAHQPQYTPPPTQPQYTPPPAQPRYVPPVAQPPQRAYDPGPQLQRSGGGGFSRFMRFLIVALVVIVLAVVGFRLIADRFSPTAKDPTGATVNQQASSNLTDVRTTLEAKADATVVKNFKVGQKIYVVYTPHIQNGQGGYALAKWYSGKDELATSDPFPVDPNNNYQYFFNAFGATIPDGSVSIYWCTKSDCADKALAGTANFTVGEKTGHNSDDPTFSARQEYRPLEAIKPYYCVVR